jgi:hypothetical protein
VKSLRGDLWNLAEEDAKIGAVAVCIPTNGDVNRWGQAVMGRGVAMQARERFPGIASVLAGYLASGNNVNRLHVVAPYGLDWTDVQPRIAFLDDRFYEVSR